MVLSAYLLHLELDGCLYFLHLGDQLVRVGDQRGEFAGLVEPRTKKTRDLLDECLGGQKSVILLGCQQKMKRLINYLSFSRENRDLTSTTFCLTTSFINICTFVDSSTYNSTGKKEETAVNGNVCQPFIL